MSTTSHQGLNVTSEQLKKKMETEEPLIIFDIGDFQRYQSKHIPGSSFASCDEESKRNIMPRLPKDIEIVLVGDTDEYPKEMAKTMNSMGLKAKYLEGGLQSWKWEMSKSEEKNLTPQDLKKILDENTTDTTRGKEIILLDVRQPHEFESWHIENSHNIPLEKITSSLNSFDKKREIVTICPRGNKAMVAKAILQRYGFTARALAGGLSAWTSAIENPSTEFEIIDKNGNKKMVKVVQIRRIGKGCLSYFLSFKDESIVIDPAFPVENYTELAKTSESKIIKIFDTHQHADHISAGKSLADKTGAEYYVSDLEEYSQESMGSNIKKIKQGDIEKIDEIEIKILNTPGHTNGSLCFLVGSKLLFTGDTLFVDGIGRPDLRDKAVEYSKLLYNTLHNKVLTLDENIVVLPAHTQKSITSKILLSGFLKDIKNNNKDLFLLGEKEFVDTIASLTIPTPPSYKDIIAINKYFKAKDMDISKINELEFGPNRCIIK
ncbi:MAG TPA: rhodanese-like domain-containing protein [Nitrososphaeraceae archaeon]|nr:rhodanese-like domain-containing protein [Nitrososphaeraceae archaeon]